MKKIYTLEFFGRTVTVETGQLAKQANGAVLVRYGDTAVLTAAVMSKEKTGADFFPLMIQYYEKLYAVGKIPGGFIKREGRPTDNATLTARLIDRPIRPLFDDGFRNDVQVINEVLSVDQDKTPEMMAMLGSSLSLSISDIPIKQACAGVVVGRVDGEFIINPTNAQKEKSDIDLIVAGTKDAINMVEASSKEVLEDDMIDALMFGHEAIKKLVAFQDKIIKEIGKEKVEVELVKVDETFEKEVIEYSSKSIEKALKVKEKLKKYAAIDEAKKESKAHFEEKYSEDEEKSSQLKYISKILNDLEANIMRDLIIEKDQRSDGRKMDELRDLAAEIDLFNRTHGSALFTRGETQVLGVVTLGALGEHQILDGLGIEDQKRFMLHYNFPQFSVGETGRYGPPGRREVGHGALGEKALQQVLPTEEEFPYTIRIVTEVLESNGSSSQASICAGSMALMGAGVPIKAPVAGIAMGLITKGDKYKILTDIQGLEDHMGDMDFKVAGTSKGICSMQMDIKIDGVTREILEKSLKQAKKARLEILDKMETAIAEPRKELSPYAPKVKLMHVSPEKIKDIIGRGGETITKIILESSNVLAVNDKNAVKVDLEDDGRIIIYHSSYDVIENVMKMIEEIVREVEDGMIYKAKVVKVEDFGCFVQLWPGCEGLVHISHLAKERVEKTSDIVKVGDEVFVKSLGLDKRGRLNLSIKEAGIKKIEKETV